MKALSIQQPWAWAILHAGKRVENRTWWPPRSLIGQTFALHASKAFDCDGQLPASVTIPWGIDYHLGSVVGVARLCAACDRRAALEWGPSQRIWAHGPVCLALDDVRVLAQPIPCRGALNFWQLTPAVEAEVWRQLESRAA